MSGAAAAGQDSVTDLPDCRADRQRPRTSRVFAVEQRHEAVVLGRRTAPLSLGIVRGRWRLVRLTIARWSAEEEGAGNQDHRDRAAAGGRPTEAHLAGTARTPR